MKIKLKELLVHLNKSGCLSSTFIMCKYKLDLQRASLWLNKVVDYCQNVHFKTDFIIYIEGREPAWWNTTNDKPRLLGNSKWKDVTKP